MNNQKQLKEWLKNRLKSIFIKKEEPYTIEKEDDVWVIKGEEVEKLFKMTKFNTDESIARFAKRLRRMGIDDKLLELGAVEGDQVRILDFYFEFK